MNSPSDRASHDWVRARLARWGAGLLDEPEWQSLEEHLVGCEPCRRSAVELTDALSADGHIPSTLLGSWARRAPALKGVLRKLVRDHLQRCPDCRRELVELRQDPGLIDEQGLESAREARARPNSSSSDGPALALAPERSRKLTARGRPVIAIAGWIAAAAAIAVVVGLLGRGEQRATDGVASDQLAQRPDTSAPGDIPSPPRAGEPSGFRPSPPLLALGPATARDLLLSETVRGSAAPAALPVAAFAPDRPEISFMPPRSLSLAEGDSVELALFDHTGAQVLRLETSLDEIFSSGARRSIVLKQGDPPLNPGNYALRIRVRGLTTSVTTESRYEFQIR